MTIITRRTATNRHTARARGLAGIPAAHFVVPSAPARPVPAAVSWLDTRPLLLPGLRPAPAIR